MMNAIVLALLLVTQVYSILIPQRVRIRADSCSFWQKDGSWYNADTNARIGQWEQRCESYSPYDLLFSDMLSNYLGRTDTQIVPLAKNDTLEYVLEKRQGLYDYVREKWQGLYNHIRKKWQGLSFPTVVRIRDESNTIRHWVKENIITHYFTGDIYTQYDIYDASGATTIGGSTELMLLGTQLTFSSGAGQVAVAHQNLANSILQDFCVEDGYWDVVFSLPANQTDCTNTTDPNNLFSCDNRLLLLELMTMKAAADINRDSKGNVSQSTCQLLHTLAIVLGTVLPGVALIAVGVWLYFYGCPLCIKNSRCWNSCLDGCGNICDCSNRCTCSCRSYCPHFKCCVCKWPTACVSCNMCGWTICRFQCCVRPHVATTSV